jgi:hypothetical protein
MNVYLKKGKGKPARRNFLIGGAVAGVLAVVCALVLANSFHRAEKRR